MPSNNENTTTGPVRDIFSKWLDTMKDDATKDAEEAILYMATLGDRFEQRAKYLMKYRDELGAVAVNQAGLSERSGVLLAKCEELVTVTHELSGFLRTQDFEDVDDVFEEDRKAAAKALAGGLKKATAAAAGSDAAEEVVSGIEKGVKRAVRAVPATHNFIRLN